jgi:hypothetical protein
LLEDKFKIENESLKRQVSFFKDVEKTLKKAQDMNSKKLPIEKKLDDKKPENLNIIKAVKRRNCSTCNCHGSIEKVIDKPIIQAKKYSQLPITKEKCNLRSSVSPFLKKKSIDCKSSNVTPTTVQFILF